jgi:hypothetical protein
MKRHRDLRFNHHERIDDAPISIIITTLDNCLGEGAWRYVLIGGSKRRPQTVALLAKVPQQFSSFKPA